MTTTAVTHFTPFHSMAGRFWVTGHFEISAPNDPQMTLYPRRSKIPQIHITTTSKSQISLRFALRPAIFELQAILKQVHLMTSKWRSALKCHKSIQFYFHSILISLHFNLRLAIFELQAILKQLHRMTLKWPSTLKGQRYPIYTCYNYPPKYHSVPLYD